MTTTSTASWKTPAVLRKALTVWACRDDTRPDPKALAAAWDAMAAIGAMIDELSALRTRLGAEMLMVEDRAEAAAEPPAVQPEPPAEAASRVLTLSPDDTWTEYKCTGCGAEYSALPYTTDPHKCAPAESAASRGLASCGHPADEDGEYTCAYWPERAPAGEHDQDDEVYVLPAGEVPALPPEFLLPPRPWKLLEAAAGGGDDEVRLNPYAALELAGAGR